MALVNRRMQVIAWLSKLTLRHMYSKLCIAFEKYNEDVIAIRDFSAVREMHLSRGLTADDFRANSSGIDHVYANIVGSGRHHPMIYMGNIHAKDSLRSASQNGHLDIIKYLHKNIGFTADDFRINENQALRLAIENGHTAVVEYLQEVIELSSDDFREARALCPAGR